MNKNHGYMLLEVLITLLLLSLLLAALFSHGSSAFKIFIITRSSLQNSYETRRSLYFIRNVLLKNTSTILSPDAHIYESGKLRDLLPEFPSSTPAISSLQIEPESAARVTSCQINGDSLLVTADPVFTGKFPGRDNVRSFLLKGLDTVGEAKGSVVKQGNSINLALSTCRYSMKNSNALGCGFSLIVPVIATETFLLDENGTLRMIRSSCGELIENQPIGNDFDFLDFSESKIMHSGYTAKRIKISLSRKKPFDVEFYRPLQIPPHLILPLFGY